MKHHVSGYQLNRDVGHRRALYKNLITALITHGAITTTLTKAKAIQGQVDRLLLKAKRGQVHHRRQIDRVLNNTATVNRLVDRIAPATGKRQSGFTRIVKLNPRRGDATLMARIEFVDPLPTPQVNDQKPAKSTKAKTKTKPAKTTAAKRPQTVTPEKDHDETTPHLTPQAAMKPGMLRRKSGER